LGAFELSVLAFSGAFALSLTTGSSRNGFELVFSLLVIYYGVKQATAGFWPSTSLWMLKDSYALGAYDWLLTGRQVRCGVLLLMLPAAAALPFLARYGFERKDL
jgi:hypothetical protein